MNCRPGDLARIVRHPLGDINDKIVRLAKEPAFYIGSTAYWNLEVPLPVVYRVTTRDARGNVCRPGPQQIGALADFCLRPIRDPGDDAVDETLIYAGDPRVREVSHG